MTYQFYALANLIAGAAIVSICICRLGMSHLGVRKLVRLKYVALLTGACAYATQPFLFGTWPTPAGTFFVLTVLIGLFCSAHRWRNRPPREVHTHTVDLAEGQPS